MAVQVIPLAPALPAVTAIEDPATRTFAQAVADSIRAMQSPEGAAQSLSRASALYALPGSGGVPSSISQMIFRSELYASLRRNIESVDLSAKQQLAIETAARTSAIDQINATLADIGAAAEYDPLVEYLVGDLVKYDGKLYRAITTTTGNVPTNITYWEKVGDYETLAGVVAAHTISLTDHDTRITNNAGSITAEASARQTLAAQLRGTYTGTDIAFVTQGLIYSERQARASADSATTTALNAQISRIDGNEAAITSEAITRADADGALSTSLTTQTGRIDSAEAAIVTEATTRATNDSALMQAINTAWAMTGATNALIQSGGVIQTNWTAAQAEHWTQLQAEVFTAGGQTIRAALAEEALIRANADGDLYGQYTVKVDLNGYVAGFGLASEANEAGVGTSKFIIRADMFAVVMPGYGEHIPFAIGPSGASFTGAQNTTGFAQPLEGWNLGTQTLETIADGKVGNTVLRLGVAVSYPTQVAYIPIDPTKKYRVRFWARPSADSNGLLYFSLRQAVNETGTWGPVNSGRSPYKPGGRSKAVHDTAFGVGQWGEYSYLWDAADWQAGVKFFRPEFLNNYNGTTGYWEVQGLVIEETTDVEAAQTAATSAQTSANTANNLLTDIASDSKLTASEKQQTKVEWDGIVAEKAGINTQATAFGITTENTDYNNAYNTLSTYITPLLSSLTTTSNIVGTTFRTNFSNLYSTRQALLNKIAAEAGTRADWAIVSGAGKPENNATVGANIGTNLTGQITTANVSTYIANAAIGSATIADAAITNAKIADAAITNAKITDAAITTAKIGTAQVDTLQLAGGAVSVSQFVEATNQVFLAEHSQTTVLSVSVPGVEDAISGIVEVDFRLGLGSTKARNWWPVEVRIYRGATIIWSKAGSLSEFLDETAPGFDNDAEETNLLTGALEWHEGDQYWAISGAMTLSDVRGNQRGEYSFIDFDAPAGTHSYSIWVWIKSASKTPYTWVKTRHLWVRFTKR